MIDRRQSSLVLDKAIEMIWQVRDHIMLEEPAAADHIVIAVMELRHADKDILRLLPAGRPTQEVTTEPIDSTGNIASS